jgi:hypothetical protein
MHAYNKANHRHCRLNYGSACLEAVGGWHVILPTAKLPIVKMSKLKWSTSKCQNSNGAPRFQIKTKIKERVTHSNSHISRCSGSLKISFKSIYQPVYQIFNFFWIFSLLLMSVSYLKKIKTCKILQNNLCIEIQPHPRPLQANSTNSPPLPLVSYCRPSPCQHSNCRLSKCWNSNGLRSQCLDVNGSLSKCRHHY